MAVLGLVDGTHIGIAPNKKVFVNRKLYHFIIVHVQVVWTKLQLS